MSATPASPREILSKWNALVNAGDKDGVLALYSNEAVLLPTFSAATRASQANIGDYFAGLSGFEAISVTIYEDSLASQPLTDSISCLSGKYLWEWTRNGQRSRIEARFTYIIDARRPAPILHHHSSVVPEAP